MLDVTWIVPQRLVVGRHPLVQGPPTQVLGTLVASGVAGVLSVHEEALPRETMRRVGVDQYLHLKVHDFDAPSMRQLKKACRFIDKVASREGATFVHCLAGLGRTGTVAASYLVWRGLDGDQAIERVRALRPGSVQTDEQADRVRQFARKFRGDGGVEVAG